MKEMNRWDLTVLYNGFDDPKYSEDEAALSALIEEAAALAESAGELSDGELIGKYIALSERINTLAGDLIIYANLSYSQNTADTKAASALGRVMSLVSGFAAPDAIVKARIAKVSDLDALIDSEGLSEYKYFLKSIKRDASHLLSDKEEAMLSKLSISGANAWSDLQSSLTSSLKVKHNGEELTLSSIRNLAYSPDPEIRRSAYEAELASYEGIKEAVAFALNSIKQQVITECELRGYASPLDKALSDSRMKRETLDALIGAMEEYLPVFRRYLLAKAKALGHKGALPWYDLFAPMGASDKTYTVKEARDYLLGIFEKFDSSLYDLVKEAFDEGWIDFYPREGKVGGAFDCGIASKGVSRVLTNFDGSFSDIVTLAHELGHSFHDRQVFGNSPLNQEYSMPVAETASTFNEVLVMETAIREATDKNEKLMLIESQLMDANQIITDIYSRFVFERSVFDNRKSEFMSADRLSELMLAAQEAAYGDGLDKDVRHPFMWLCKCHYYSGGLSFYNFPYAFGGLFARGLFAKYKAEGRAFIDTYKKLLNLTGMSDVEETAAVAGIDLTKREFWKAGLDTIAEQIEEFIKLVG